MERPDAWLMTDQLTHELGKGDPFAAAIRATRMPMIITDPRQHDNPIVFANEAFLRLTNYTRDEVMGRNCRFLQGTDTDRRAIEQIKMAIGAARDISIDVLNYRKDGTPFWNALYISPVITSDGELQFFFASQLDVTWRKDALAAKTALIHEVDHRVKNNLQMIGALISMQAANIADPEVRRSLTRVMEHVEALSSVHRRLYQSDDVTRFSVAEFIVDIVTDLVGASGRKNIDVCFDLDPVTVPADKASPIALIVNELVTNALKHALSPQKGGKLTIVVKQSDERFRIEVEDDGVGMPAEVSHPADSFGLDLVRMMARQLRAKVTSSASTPSGTRVTLDMPIEQPVPVA